MKQQIIRDAVYSREETAEVLGVSLSTVKRLLATGALRASTIEGTRRVLILGSSILEMLERQTQVAMLPVDDEG